MNKVIINAEGAVFGRLCSFAAKQSLEGNEVIIVNSDKAVVTGNRGDVLKKYQERKARGGKSRKGPNYPRDTSMMMKRAIRGMLPDYRWGEGKAALSNIKCYNGIPKEFEGKDMIKIPGPSKNKFVVLKEISERM